MLRAELVDPERVADGSPLQAQLRWEGPTLRGPWRVRIDGTIVQRGSGAPSEPWVVSVPAVGPKDPVVELLVPNGDGTDSGYGTRLSIPPQVRRAQRIRPVAQLRVASVTGTSPARAVLQPSASTTGSGGTITRWELAFGDGAVERGEGRPPASVAHDYGAPGSEAVVMAASLTVWANVTVGTTTTEIASLSAQALVRIEPDPSAVDPSTAKVARPTEAPVAAMAVPTNGIGIVIVAVDASGVATFGVVLGSGIDPTQVERWSLTVDGEAATPVPGSAKFPGPVRATFAFEPVSTDTESDVLATVVLADGTTLTAPMAIVLVPVDGPTPPTQELTFDRPPSLRRDDFDSDPDPDGGDGDR